jgi:hypothetical protein
MGGNAFKSPDGNLLSVSIFKDEVRPTIAQVISVLADVGIDQTELLGSSGKKAESGDIDLAIGPIPPGEDPKAFKARALEACVSAFGPEHAKLVGQNIALNVPIVSSDPSRQEMRVQVDLMISADPSKTAWLMSGTAGGPGEVKGVYRNLLLAYVAKKVGEMRGDKITISYPGGIQVMRGAEVIVPRTEDPHTIISVLGLDGTPSDLLTFDSVFDAAQGLIDLAGFEDYMAPYLSRDPEEAGKAQAAFRRKSGRDQLIETRILRSAIRNFIRS